MLHHHTVPDPVFRPAWWLPGPHCQTLWPALMRPRRSEVRLQRLELPDGDFLDLAWNRGEQGPLVVIIHGLEGSVESHYIPGLLSEFTRRGWRAALVHLRGCSGEHNRLARRYHAGETGDIEFVIRTLRSAYPNEPIAAVGFSLGGNMLLKWLGETGRDTPLAAAVAVSVPFELEASVRALEQGAGRLYQWYLLRALKRSTLDKFSCRPAPFDMAALRHVRTLFEFDDLVTAPLHGFEGARDYYRRMSCRQYLRGIAAPTLILQAADDPMVPATTIPRLEELSDATRLALSPCGGHVGFVGSRFPARPVYFLEQRIPEFLAACLTTARGQAQPAAATNTRFRP